MNARIRSIIIAAVAVGVALPVAALNTRIPTNGMLSANQYSSTILPDLQGVVSWKTLGQVEPTVEGGRISPQFSKAVADLDAQNVRVQGFILPMDMGDKQKHFLVSAVPPHCPFCLPAGPEAVVEVFARQPIPYGMEPIIVSGKMAVLKDEPGGLLYRLSDAELVETKLK